jgi:hypothetical protein
VRANRKRGKTLLQLNWEICVYIILFSNHCPPLCNVREILLEGQSYSIGMALLNFLCEME